MKKEIKHTFSSADTTESLIDKPANSKLHIAGVWTSVHPGLSNEDVSIMDGTATIGQIDVTSGINSGDISTPLEIDNTLQAQVSNTAIQVSVWATTG